MLDVLVQYLVDNWEEESEFRNVVKDLVDINISAYAKYLGEGAAAKGDFEQPRMATAEFFDDYRHLIDMHHDRIKFRETLNDYITLNNIINNFVDLTDPDNFDYFFHFQQYMVSYSDMKKNNPKSNQTWTHILRLTMENYCLNWEGLLSNDTVLAEVNRGFSKLGIIMKNSYQTKEKKYEDYHNNIFNFLESEKKNIEPESFKQVMKVYKDSDRSFKKRARHRKGFFDKLLITESEDISDMFSNIFGTMMTQELMINRVPNRTEFFEFVLDNPDMLKKLSKPEVSYIFYKIIASENTVNIPKTIISEINQVDGHGLGFALHDYIFTDDLRNKFFRSKGFSGKGKVYYSADIIFGADDYDTLLLWEKSCLKSKNLNSLFNPKIQELISEHREYNDFLQDIVVSASENKKGYQTFEILTHLKEKGLLKRGMIELVLENNDKIKILKNIGQFKKKYPEWAKMLYGSAALEYEEMHGRIIPRKDFDLRKMDVSKNNLNKLEENLSVFYKQYSDDEMQSLFGRVSKSKKTRKQKIAFLKNSEKCIKFLDIVHNNLEAAVHDDLANMDKIIKDCKIYERKKLEAYLYSVEDLFLVEKLQHYDFEETEFSMFKEMVESKDFEYYAGSRVPKLMFRILAYGEKEWFNYFLCQMEKKSIKNELGTHIEDFLNNLDELEKKGTEKMSWRDLIVATAYVKPVKKKIKASKEETALEMEREVPEPHLKIKGVVYSKSYSRDIQKCPYDFETVRALERKIESSPKNKNLHRPITLGTGLREANLGGRKTNWRLVYLVNSQGILNYYTICSHTRLNDKCASFKENNIGETVKR